MEGTEQTKKKPEELSKRELTSVMNAYLRPLRSPIGRRQESFLRKQQIKLEKLQAMRESGWKVGGGRRQLSSVEQARASQQLAVLEGPGGMSSPDRVPDPAIEETFILALPYIVSKLGLTRESLARVGVPTKVLEIGLDPEGLGRGRARWEEERKSTRLDPGEEAANV